MPVVDNTDDIAGTGIKLVTQQLTIQTMNVGDAFMQSPLTSVSVPSTPVIPPSNEGHVCMLRRTTIKESNNDSILPTQISAENPNVGVVQVVLRPPY